MTKIWMRLAPLLAAMCLLTVAMVARAEDYVLGSEDVVAVSVYLHPELDRVLTVDIDGNVTLPPVGEIKAGGLSPKQLGDRMGDRLSAYLRQTTTVTVTVTQFMSRSVYVSGGVARPGRYGFERIPNMLDVLGQAGGALPGVDLSAVQILRKEGASGRTLTADVARALRTGDPSTLPELKPGDSIVLPGVVAPGSASSTDGVGVLGEVNRPGVYTIVAGADVWGVLAAAGGLTARANLKDVRLLTHSAGGLNVSTLNLNEVLEHGARAPMTVKVGDVVVVMQRGLSVWTDLVNVLSLSRDMVDVAVFVDYMKNHK